jgi:hypothetical protein
LSERLLDADIWLTLAFEFRIREPFDISYPSPLSCGKCAHFDCRGKLRKNQRPKGAQGLTRPFFARSVGPIMEMEPFAINKTVPRWVGALSMG